jgi:hypothetical protein
MFAIRINHDIVESTLRVFDCQERTFLCWRRALQIRVTRQGGRACLGMVVRETLFAPKQREGQVEKVEIIRR